MYIRCWTDFFFSVSLQSNYALHYYIVLPMPADNILYFLTQNCNIICAFKNCLYGVDQMLNLSSCELMIQLHEVKRGGVRGKLVKVTFNVIISCIFINVIEWLHCSLFCNFFAFLFQSNHNYGIKTLNVCLRLFCVIHGTVLALMHNNAAENVFNGSFEPFISKEKSKNCRRC